MELHDKNLNRSPRVAIAKEGGRRENVRRSLELIIDDIERGRASRRPLIKPNFVSSTNQLASSHVDQVRGILDVFTSIYRDKIIIAEAACYDTEAAYNNFGYRRLTDEYNVELRDLNHEPAQTVMVLDRQGRRIPIRVAEMLLHTGYYLISAANMKTHDTVVVTLAIKNLAVGCIVGTDKKSVHQGIVCTNQNIAMLAGLLWPDLSVIDGYEGMEGNGPTQGDPVPLGIALTSTDALAADRVACEIMAVDFHNVGYLHLCAERGLGEADLHKIEILGEPVGECIRPFKLHKSVRDQYAWKSKLYL